MGRLKVAIGLVLLISGVNGLLQATNNGAPLQTAAGWFGIVPQDATIALWATLVAGAMVIGVLRGLLGKKKRSA